MNIEKRRQTRIVGPDLVHKHSLTPFFEDMDLLKPEYEPEDSVKLYELNMRKRRDTDAVPVQIAMFGMIWCLQIYI